MKAILPLLAIAAVLALASCSTAPKEECSGGSCCAPSAKTVKNVH